MKNPDRWIRILCIILMLLLVVTLLVLREELFCSSDEGSQSGTDEHGTTAAPIIRPADAKKRDYTGREFNYELNMGNVTSFPQGYNYADPFWFEITPPEWKGHTDLRLVKHEQTGITCLIDSNGAIWPITQAQLTNGIQLVGFGLMDVLLTDCDEDGNYELLVSCSYEVNGSFRSSILLIDLDNASALTSWPMLNLSVDNKTLMLDVTEEGKYLAREAEWGFLGEGTTDWQLFETENGQSWTFEYHDGELRTLDGKD